MLDRLSISIIYIYDIYVYIICEVFYQIIISFILKHCKASPKNTFFFIFHLSLNVVRKKGVSRLVLLGHGALHNGAAVVPACKILGCSI